MRSRAAWMARRRALNVPWRNPVKTKVGRGDVPGWSVRMERQKASTRFCRGKVEGERLLGSRVALDRGDALVIDASDEDQR